MKTMMMRFAAPAVLAAMLCVAPVQASAEEPSLKGMVISNDGTTLVVRGDAGDTNVSLTGDTKVRGVTGVLGVRGDDYPATALIRGLPVAVTTGADGAASEITFKQSDLKTARQISAGLVTTDANVASNRQDIASNAEGISANSDRIDNVGMLVPAGRTSVFFALGSATLSEQGKQDLQAIAAKAKEIKGAYRLAVVVRADTSGNAAANQRLSERRAAAVTDYLQQSAAVSPANFIPAAALGSASVAQDPNPPKNAAEARRVTVTIAVSKSNIQKTSN